MRFPNSRSPADLLSHERAVVGAVARRLPGEARKLLEDQVSRVGRVFRPRHVPELCLWSGGQDGEVGTGGALFPRRDEFVLARVALRCGSGLHRCEVVAVGGRVLALLMSPPLPGDGSFPVRIVGVEMGADPMDPGDPGRRRERWLRPVLP
ncbi:MAG TPA: hypothetical protein VE173_06325, partial [Longimicrobiales bacterium]|nr:hypothetical protein [Longimicrobiales bacterium]